MVPLLGMEDLALEVLQAIEAWIAGVDRPPMPETTAFAV